MKFNYVFGVAATLLATAAIAAADGYTLKPMQKAGDVRKYKNAVKLDAGGAEFDVSFVTTRKITKVEDSGAATVKESVTDMKFNGQDAPEGQGPGDTTTTYSAKGEVKKIEGERTDESSYRMGNLFVMIVPDNPVSVGDTWSYNVKDDKTTGAVASKATFTLVSEDKVGDTAGLKVKFVVKESGDGGASSEGTYWVSKSDFSLLKMEGKMLNVPITGAGIVSGSISVTLAS